MVILIVCLCILVLPYMGLPHLLVSLKWVHFSTNHGLSYKHGGSSMSGITLLYLGAVAVASHFLSQTKGCEENPNGNDGDNNANIFGG